MGDLCSIPGFGRFPRGGHGHLEVHGHSCLENPHGQRSLARYRPQNHRVRHNRTTKHSTYLKKNLQMALLLIQILTFSEQNPRRECYLLYIIPEDHIYITSILSKNKSEIFPLGENRPKSPVSQACPLFCFQGI